MISLIGLSVRYNDGGDEEDDDDDDDDDSSSELASCAFARLLSKR